ncbi:tripartite tricarboxylate transporter substrate binding protein [Acetobacteraceae bacterium H6797]|nr:tripartite tricarboxylate transporter substrate binding protein [Acetobacteraceae bacterium H6797]
MSDQVAPFGVPRRALLRAAGLAMPAIMVASRGWAAGYPDKPVRVVVPFTPGGSTDILARAVAQKLTEDLKQSFVIDNRGGAGGTVGSEMVARSAPDGYTIMMGHIGTLGVNPTLYQGLSFDIAKSFDPIVMVAEVANVLVVNPKVPAENTRELIALARKKPGGLTYGSGGNGSAAHIAVAAFAQAAQIELTHVPYRGTGPMMNDLVAGQLDMTMTGGPPALPPVRSGLLRALGVSSKNRIEAAPDLPTIAESGGLPGFEAVQWYGLVAPTGTPRPIIEKLNQEVARILKDPTLKQRLSAEGAEAKPGTPEEFGAYITSERERWGKLIREANLKAD